MADKSIVEKMICSRDFFYMQPYFYQNPYALRCELGIGDTNEAYLKNAHERAMAIYHILFPKAADAIFFNYWLYDYSDSGEAEILQFADLEPEDIIENRICAEAEQLRFLSEYQLHYRHFTVRDLPTYEEPDDYDYGWHRRNRVICYADGKNFDYENLISNQIYQTHARDVSFVSFENECIYSVYDDRGCDIVFMTQEKLKEFYYKLQPYFLEYDLEEMQKRFEGHV